MTASDDRASEPASAKPTIAPPASTSEVESSPPPAPAKRSLLQPLSGAALLGLDWLVFTSGWLTGWLALPVASAVAATLAAAVTWWAQRRAGDSRRAALGKATAAAALVAVPLPIAGSAVGAWVLALSGLKWLSRD